MSTCPPHPSQPTTPFNPSAIPSLTHVHSNFAPNYTSFSPTYHPAETPMPAHKKRRVDDDLLPSFTSPASGSTTDHIKALTAEIEQPEKKLDKLTKERETFRYKKRAPRLDVRQKLDAIFNVVKDVAKWTLGEFLFKLKNEDGTKFHRSSTHAATVSQFLQGQTTYSPSDILDAWFRNSDGGTIRVLTHR